MHAVAASPSPRHLKMPGSPPRVPVTLITHPSPSQPVLLDFPPSPALPPSPTLSNFSRSPGGGTTQAADFVQRQRASSALAQAGLGLVGLLSRPGPSDGGSDTPGALHASFLPELGTDGLGIGMGTGHNHRAGGTSPTRKVSFGESLGISRPSSVAPLSAGVAPGTSVAGQTSAPLATPPPEQPTPRKTSGPRAFLRRAKSFGTASSSGWSFPGSHQNSNGAASTSQLPPSPPLPSPTLPPPHFPPGTSPTVAPPSPALSTASSKGKERASALPDAAPHWLFASVPPPSPTIPTHRERGLSIDTDRKASLLKRRSFSLWRRGDPADSSPVDNHDSSDAATTASFDSTRPDEDPPSLPALHLSSRMSWAWGAQAPAESPTTSPHPSPSKQANVQSSPGAKLRTSRRPHSSSGPPGGGGWGSRPESIVSSPAEESREEAVGLGFDVPSRPASLKRQSTLTRLVRSNSDVGNRPYTPPFLSPSGQRFHGTSTPPVNTPSPQISRSPSPLKPNASYTNTPLSTSPERDRLSRAQRSSNSQSRRPSTASGTERGGGVFGAVTGFFSNSIGSSNSTGASNMSRSSSTASVGANGASTPALGGDVSEFGSLFDKGKGSRKRGLSVGTTLFSPSPSRPRAGSSSSLSNAWVPPSGGSLGASLTVPNASTDVLVTLGMVGSPGGGGGSASTGRSRASTDARRFSFSSNASSQSSIPPLPSPRLFPQPTPPFQGVSSPPTSPPITRQSSSGQLKARARAASIKVAEGETPEAYVQRLLVEISKSEIARTLSSQYVPPTFSYVPCSLPNISSFHSSDAFYSATLTAYLRTFDFSGDPLDIALRKLLMEASLPTETQQIDRVMEAFAVQYNASNPGLFASSDTPYVLAFSLVMLSTDQFNPSNKNKMSKADYVKNTKVEGVSTEVLEVRSPPSARWGFGLGAWLTFFRLGIVGFTVLFRSNYDHAVRVC